MLTTTPTKPPLYLCNLELQVQQNDETETKEVPIIFREYSSPVGPYDCYKLNQPAEPPFIFIHATNMYYSGADAHFVIEPIPEDKYMGQRAIAVAYTKYFTSTPSLRCHPSESLGIYIARTVHDCRVPRIVPYSALYLLASISRSCRCGRSTSTTSIPLDTYNTADDPSEKILKSPSSLSHRFSEAIHRSPLSRVRKPHWGGSHLFMGSLLIALRIHFGTLDIGALSGISGFSSAELEELEESMSSCMNEDTRSMVEWMIKEGNFRSLLDVECPFVIMRRKREAAAEAAILEGEEEIRRPGSLRRLFSNRRSRGISLSSCETE